MRGPTHPMSSLVMPTPLSILDLAFVPEGQSPASALAACVALAQRAESLG